MPLTIIFVSYKITVNYVHYIDKIEIRQHPVITDSSNLIMSF